MARYVNILATSKSLSAEGYATTAAIACRIAERLGMPETVQGATRNLFEQWNGGGAPQGLHGEEIPRISRVVLPTFFLVPFHRVSGREAAVQPARPCEARLLTPT